MGMARIHISFLIPLFFMACGGISDPDLLFEIQLEGNKIEFQQNDQVGVSILNKKGKHIDQVVYRINERQIALDQDKINLNLPTLGTKTLTATISFEGNQAEVKKTIKLLAKTAPEIYTYEIINEFPHDRIAYTQGLEFHGDTLYESTGRKGHSSLRKVDFKTGKVLQQIKLDDI